MLSLTYPSEDCYYIIVGGFFYVKFLGKFKMAQKNTNFFIFKNCDGMTHIFVQFACLILIL